MLHTPLTDLNHEAKRVPDASSRSRRVRVDGRVLSSGAHGDCHVHVSGVAIGGGLVRKPESRPWCCSDGHVHVEHGKPMRLLQGCCSGVVVDHFDNGMDWAMWQDKLLLHVRWKNRSKRFVRDATSLFDR